LGHGPPAPHQLTGHSDDDLVGMVATGAESSLPFAPPDLGRPAAVLADVGVFGPSPVARSADLCRVAVGPGAFHQRPSGLGVPRVGHGAVAASRPRRRCRRDQPQELHALSGVRQAGEVAACGHRGDGHGAWHPPQGLQDLDHGVEAPRLPRCVACVRQTLQALRGVVDRAHLCVEHEGGRRGGTAHLREPAEVGRAPGGPAGVAAIAPQPAGVAPACGGLERAAGRFAGPTELPNGGVCPGGASDGGEVSRAPHPGPCDRVTAGGFAAVA
jgi:hypothetical protein